MTSVREYLESSKNALYAAYMKNPSVSHVYEITKYCKVPVLDGKETVYISVRPQDLVEVVSLTRDGKEAITSVRFVCHHNLDIVDSKYHPKWHHRKMMKWIDANTVETSPTELSMQSFDTT